MRRRSGLVMLVFVGGVAAAAPPASTPNGATPVASSVASPAAAAPFVDRLIDGGGLTADVQAEPGAVQAGGADGWPRRLSTELRGLHQSGEGYWSGKASSVYAMAQASLDTPDHGYLSLQLVHELRRHTSTEAGESSSPRTLASVSQRRLIVGGGWQVDTTLGSMSTPLPALAQSSPRLWLPSRALRGASSEWTQGARGLRLMASVGEADAVDLFGLAGQSLTTPRERVANLGASIERGPWRWALVLGHQKLPGAARAQGLWQSLRHESATAFVQAHLLAQRGALGQTAGAWIDAGWDEASMSHRLGVHHVPRDVQWLGSSLGLDTRGTYYRLRHSTRRDTLEAQVDVQQALGTGRAQQQLWLNGRHALDTQRAVGAQLSVHRDAQGLASRAYLWGDWSRASGQWRVFSSLGQQPASGTLTQLGGEWAKELNGAVRASVSASLAREDERRLTELGLAIDGPLTPALDAHAQLRVLDDAQGAGLSHSLSAGLEWALARGWRLSGSVSLTQGHALSATIGPGATAPSLLALARVPQRQQSIWFGLRQDLDAGSASRILGDAGGGAGRIEGRAFLDLNGNGVFDASEAAVPDLAILLDDKYLTRTDAQGRFDYPRVAVGPHELRAIQDNLPLPWQLANGGRRSVDVRLRQTHRVAWGARQDLP